ncbi:MAG: MBL fold metallo-hydrolase [Chloroflexota bacterium]|nr:MBL fold metallo-hydrolase [Chloroflexota bacterium]
MLELTFLGTGTSTGVPVIGCDCEVCQSPDPRDARLRCSVVVRTDTTTVLVDTSPDLRTQVLRDRFDRFDAVLFTHAHADHTAGLDELRRYNAIQQEHIPLWADAATAHSLRERFAYTFVDQYPVYGVIPDLVLNEIDGPFRIGDLDIQPIPVMHGRLPILGYRFGSIGYLTDVKSIPDESRELLQDLDVLILTALRQKPHAAHLALEEALAVAESVQPRYTLFTHVAHEMGRYAEVTPTLPEETMLAHDRQRIVIDDTRTDAGRVRLIPSPDSDQGG